MCSLGQKMLIVKLKLIYPKERRIEHGPSKIEHGHFENGTCFLEPRLTLWPFQFHDSMIVFMSRWPGCQGLHRLTLKIWLCPTTGYPHTQQMALCGGSQWVGYIIYPCFLQVWTYRISPPLVNYQSGLLKSSKRFWIVKKDCSTRRTWSNQISLTKLIIVSLTWYPNLPIAVIMSYNFHTPKTAKLWRPARVKTAPAPIRQALSLGQVAMRLGASFGSMLGGLLLLGFSASPAGAGITPVNSVPSHGCYMEVS